MKKNILLLIILLGFSDILFSQIGIKSAYLGGDYMFAIDKKANVYKAYGPGFGGNVQFRINEIFSFSIHGSYNYVSIEQDSALEKWNWRFWNERYKGIVADNLKSDSAITASLVAQQRMDIIPVSLTLDADIVPGFLSDLLIKPYFGLGAIIYTRQLFLNETWRKYFASVDYNFEYSYNNFAPNKSGTQWIGIAGLDLGYQFTENFYITCGSKITFILNTRSLKQDDNLPLDKLINIKLGLIFLY